MQETNSQARAYWKLGATFFDYLYLAFTGATAFSPTDTMPLSRRAKFLMMLEAILALIIISFLASRAINIIGRRQRHGSVPLVTLWVIISGSQMFGYLGVIFAAPMTDLIQALVGAFWQSHQKIHTEEFLLEQLERIVKGNEEPTLPTIDELEMNEPSPGLRVVLLHWRDPGKIGSKTARDLNPGSDGTFSQ